MFSLQALGAAAQPERALVARRTEAELTAARSRGRVDGNPGLCDGDPDAVRTVRVARNAAHLEKVLAHLNAWLPTVRRMRPEQPRGDVVRVPNWDETGHWTVTRLGRTVRHLACEGIVQGSLLTRACPQPGGDRLVRLVAGIKAAAPGRTFQQIATQPEGMRERTSHGGTRWHPSSVRNLLLQAEQRGVAGTPPGHIAPEVWL